MMKDVQLNSNTTIPPVGFGTWELVPDTIARSVVTLALHAGYRLIDTANMYRNEIGIGQAIHDSGIDRTDIFVTTKLWSSEQGYDSTHKAFDNSLDRLDVDYVDLYLVHWPTDKERMRESWRALEEIHTAGRARAIGVSNYTVRHLEELLTYATIQPAVNQIEFHPFIYEAQKAIADFCHHHDITVEGYSPLARGSRVRDPRISAIGQKLGKSNAQILIRWGIQHAVIPLPRSTDERHIEGNIDVFDFSLSTEDMKTLDALSDGTRIAPDPYAIA
jgi:diketogulonate reductase-like aldo/keto reductase